MPAEPVEGCVITPPGCDVSDAREPDERENLLVFDPGAYWPGNYETKRNERHKQKRGRGEGNKIAPRESVCRPEERNRGNALRPSESQVHVDGLSKKMCLVLRASDFSSSTAAFSVRAFPRIVS